MAGRPINNERHRQVAAIYNEAVEHDPRPNLRVAEALGISHSAARTAVYAARRAGFIPPAAGPARATAARTCPTCGATAGRWTKDPTPPRRRR